MSNVINISGDAINLCEVERIRYAPESMALTLFFKSGGSVPYMGVAKENAAAVASAWQAANYRPAVTGPDSGGESAPSPDDVTPLEKA